MKISLNWLSGFLHSIISVLIFLYLGTAGSQPVSKVTSTKAPTTTLILSTANATEVIPTMKNPAKIGGMVTRGLYVLSIVCGLVVLYLIVRWVCSKRRQSKTRRYGVLNDRNHDSMEMRPLSEDDDDDDDDLTLFDASKQKRKNKR